MCEDWSYETDLTLQDYHKTRSRYCSPSAVCRNRNCYRYPIKADLKVGTTTPPIGKQTMRKPT